MAGKNSYKGLSKIRLPSSRLSPKTIPKGTPASSELGKSSETSGTVSPVTVQLSVYFSVGILAVISVNGHESISLLR